MLEKLINLDHQLFVFLNGLGSEKYDGFWLLVTKQLHWTPFFLVLLYLVFTKIGKNNTLKLLLTIAVLILLTDQFTNFIKDSFERLRPCNNPELQSIIRIVKDSDTFSFFSGHAANSMAGMTFIFLTIRRYYKYAFLVFLFPLLFAYSRIYLGLHFPSDILTGYCFGAAMGNAAYHIYNNYLYK